MREKFILLSLLVIVLSSCAGETTSKNQAMQEYPTENLPIIATVTPFQPAESTISPTNVPKPVYLTGAGDISVCGQDTDDATSALLGDMPGIIFTLGDTQYNEGTYEQFVECFGNSWGKYKERMIPVIGNHEYENEHATGYFDYFDNELDPNRLGYYSQNIGSWHVVVLNSQCDEIGGCDEKSEMIQWLREDLSTHTQLCTLALWHAPRFSTGYHGPDEAMDPIWRMIVENNVDLVLNGHEHNYERFAPMDENGDIHLSDGTRMIIVGTGGASLRPQYLEHPASVVYNNSTYGVLQLMLDYGTYTWEFIPVEENGFSDSGRGYCH